jgi:hypothetical protein
MTKSAPLGLLCALLFGCGGRTLHPPGELGASESDDAGAVGASASDASGAAAPLFQAVYPQWGPPHFQDAGTTFMKQCLKAPLPVGGNGVPDCVVISARSSVRTADGSSCDPCGPGLEPYMSSLPLESIGAGLSDYPCLCAVPSLPPASGACELAREQSPDGFWCYAPMGGTNASTCAPDPGPALLYSTGLMESGTVYVACFEPQTTP